MPTNTNRQLRRALPKFNRFFGNNSILVIIGALVGFCCILGGVAASIYGYANSINQDAVARMQSLTGVFAQEQVVFSEVDLNKMASYQGFVLGVQGMQAVSGDMIRGKFNDTYQQDTGCNASGVCEHYKGDPIAGQINPGLVINALHEAYPDLSNQAVADLATKMIDVNLAEQTKYSNFQQKRLDEARSFNTWRNGGGPEGDMIRAWILRNVWDIPGRNDNLYAFIGKEKLIGQDALDYMLKPIVSSNAAATYQNGIQQPSIPGGNPFATPSNP